jgi:predicted ATPase/class 3 adenylate cyclase
LRALLLTDVVDSTRLAERIGDAAMAEAWAAHDRAARDLLPACRGREIDKTDGMLLMFDAAADAVAYALAYHRALAALPRPLQARAGLHVGPVTLRHNDAADIARGAKPIEVEGLAKPVAARVMSLARGGQTLLTAEARAGLADSPLRVESHGHWVMKGITEPIELFEAGEQGAPFAPPPDSEKVYRVVRSGERWLPVREIPNNLPLQTTSFIGRERELSEIKAHLAGARLLTLLGMGGLGKTRLSLQAAAEVMAEYPDGAWFLDLAPLRDPALVVGEAAQALGLREEPGRPLVQTLCAHIKPLRALFVFDNCEHLIRASAELANAMLRAAPQVHVLASSREPLHVPGEQTYPILPLPVPGRSDGVAALARSTAVRLFVERAQAHKPAFALNEREAPAVAELVARLEGIPLALELAAARVRSMSVADINARLKDRYKLLTGGARVHQERQQTLRALVDWSHDMLSEDEQRVLARLGVFVGGFDLAAAEPVCGAEPLDPFDVLDLVGSLVEKSLVMLEDRAEGARYRMLETIRDYAREKLDASGEAAPTAERHCLHYFVLAKEARDGMKGPEQAEWIRRLETEHDNLRSATALALAGGVDPMISVKLAVALHGFWMFRGYSTEGRKVVEAALALPAVQASDLAQAHALYVGAVLAQSQSDHAQALHMLETCLDLRRRLDSEVDIAATLSTLSLARLQAGDVAGAARGEEEALQIFRRLADRYGEAICLLHLGQIDLCRGEDARARTRLGECLEIARAIGQQEIEGECELVSGQIAFLIGDADRAERHFARSLTVCSEAADTRGAAHALLWLGRAALRRAELAAAGRQLGEALTAFRDFDMREELLDCLADHAVLAQASGATELAARLAATATRLRDRLGLARPPRLEQLWQVHLQTIREAAGGKAFDAAWNEPWEVDAAVRHALAITTHAVAA